MLLLAHAAAMFTTTACVCPVLIEGEGPKPQQRRARSTHRIAAAAGLPADSATAAGQAGWRSRQAMVW